MINTIKSKWILFWHRFWFGTVDDRGYRRDRGGHLLHRTVAYWYIYRTQRRDEYPLMFQDYQIHHADRNKKNNNISNLRLLTAKEHMTAHGIRK